MKSRPKNTAYRQAAWDFLRGGNEPPSVKALADQIGCTPDGLRGYISALERNGYISRASGPLVLIRNTGAAAPGWSVHTSEFFDTNLPPLEAAVSADDLRSAVASSGLSHADWLRQHGFHPAATTRLREMMAGTRNVSDAIAAAVAGG